MVVSAAVGRLPVDFGLEDSRHWVSSTQVYNAVDVSHQGSAVSTWSQVFCLESVIDGTLGVGSDVEALIMHHTPLWYNLAQVVDRVLFDESHWANDSMWYHRSCFMWQDQLPTAYNLLL
jgi:hypothetical protein